MGLEFLRFQQCVNQVREEEEGGDAADDVVHSRVPLKVVASFREEPADGEKREAEQDVENV